MQIAERSHVTRHRLSVEDFYRLGEAGVLHEEDRVELIEGDIIDMAPIGSRHAGTINRLADDLLDRVAHRAIVSVQNPVRLDRYSEPQPDVCLLRPREDFYAEAHPTSEDVLLLIEVAESSLAYDRDVKVPLYARSGIPEVWLLDVEARRLQVFRGPRANGYAESFALESPWKIAPELLPDLTLDLAALVGPDRQAERRASGEDADRG